MTACPKCVNPGLVHTLIDEALPAHSCPDCGGTLLSLIAYRRWRDTFGGNHEALDGKLEAVQAEDSMDAISCPKCRRVMTKYQISAAADNRIDYCVSCEEIWLDEGEWDLIANLIGTDQLAAVLSKSWQYRLRTDRLKKMEEERLRFLLGSDYERACAVREWLSEHPSRTEILAFVSRKSR